MAGLGLKEVLAMFLSRASRVRRRLQKKKSPSLKDRFRCFQALLEANNSALEVMGDLEGRYFQGAYPFDRRYVRDSYTKVRENVLQMIEALNFIASDRYRSLYGVFEKIDRGIQEAVFGVTETLPSPLTIPFAEITREMSEMVGGKSANLGEMRNRMHLPVPEGFAISAYAYKTFLGNGVLGNDVAKRLAAVNIHDRQAVSQLSREIQQAVLAGSVPPELKDAILQAYLQLAAPAGREIAVSVRSSAVHEDSDISFAGQYATILNVSPHAILQAYKKVIASKFTPQAIFYWKEMGFSEEDIPVAVACQTMIDARTSGVMYSRDPNHPGRNVVIISAMWGVGELVVGRASPNVYVVSRETGEVLEKKTPVQESMLVCKGAGIGRVPVPEEQRLRPCLGEEEIEKLSRYAVVLENHYQTPRDIEWVIDGEGKIYILQTRDLKMASGSAEKEETSPDPDEDKILINWGLVAATGVGAGPVHLVKKDRDLHPFPQGGVLVVRSFRPNHVTVMDKASAIICEIGNVAGHMASLAREAQIPTIVDAKDATKLLRPGQMVTVDANRNKIYNGTVDEILRRKKRDEEARKSAPVLKKVEQLVSRIVSLKLLDSKAVSFQPESCQTLHDITRFIHEMSIREMFRLHESEKASDKQAVQLVSDLKINLYVIDLGGGLSVEGRDLRVRPEEISSLPMRALWRGITHPKVRWTGMVDVDLKGFASVMLNTLSDSGRYGTQLGEKSYAIVSKEYMNFNSRLAYHFSTVDAYCSGTKNNNYIQFQFMGGGSSSERRSRRVRFIAGVLRNLDFEVETKGDWLQARLEKYECHGIEQKLDYVGRLMCCARQLDMAMYSENVIDWYVQAFMRGNYAFEKTPARAAT
ncbi:MAG: PEP/pyruvate-binding domain-containing protein [Syntrophorhabdales bacterium]|jgi:pyruvate,water dikinase